MEPLTTLFLTKLFFDTLEEGPKGAAKSIATSFIPGNELYTVYEIGRDLYGSPYSNQSQIIKEKPRTYNSNNFCTGSSLNYNSGGGSSFSSGGGSSFSSGGRGSFRSGG